jgi:hypothetical protein
MAIWNVELTLTLRMPHVIAVEADDADCAQRMAARVLAHEVKALLCLQKFELHFPEESPPAVFFRLPYPGDPRHRRRSRVARGH